MKRILQVVISVAAVSCLGACGSGGGDSIASTEVATPSAASKIAANETETRAGVLDNFGQHVAGVVGSTSEETQPISTDAIVPSTPENTHPAPIMQ